MGQLGTKDPQASDVHYVQALVAPDTIGPMPEETMLAFAQHGTVEGELSGDGGDAEKTLAEFAKAGVDVDELAAILQREVAASFSASWNNLMNSIAAKSVVLGQSEKRA